jgi:glycosyltransferase involved in cell wall biosynthesis
MALVPGDLDVRLVVVGDVGVATSGYARELEARAGELLGSRARFVGRRDDVADVLRAIDILVNCSPAEPFGRSVLEAQATGLAVIGMRQGGVPEFVTDGETGLLVEPGDVTRLAAAITELAAHRCVRERLGGAARAQAVERFDVWSRYDVVADVIGRVARR